MKKLKQVIESVKHFKTITPLYISVNDPCSRRNLRKPFTIQINPNDCIKFVLEDKINLRTFVNPTVQTILDIPEQYHDLDVIVNENNDDFIVIFYEFSLTFESKSSSF